MKNICVSAILCLVCAAVGVACGGDEKEPVPPTITGIEVNCGDPPADSYVDVQVVKEVAAKVSDSDRDLGDVKGSINGIVIEELTDDDADQKFNWTPPTTLDPMRCTGEIVVRVEASDAAGNITKETKIITK